MLLSGFGVTHRTAYSTNKTAVYIRVSGERLKTDIRKHHPRGGKLRQNRAISPLKAAQKNAENC